LQLHKDSSTLAADRAPTKADRTKRLTARDERKFPLEFLRRAAIKSVTSVTNSAGGAFYDSSHKILFYEAFQPHPVGKQQLTIGLAEIAESG
jgi:hypothetical protein